ncbi:MAG: type II secretion system protein [Pirellulaceae bacterium]
MIAHSTQRRLPRENLAFTLVELLVVITIISMLASVAVFTMFGVREDVREKSTQATVSQIGEIIATQFEEYRVRPLPIQIPAGASPELAAKLRLYAVRQLMRMELPDRVTDVVDLPVMISVDSVSIMMPNSSLWLAYRRRAEAALGVNWANTWTVRYQGAECLYMILAAIRDGDRTGLDGISESRIGDVDEDKMPEILDAWGKPIEFLRWAPGFLSEIQSRRATDAPDFFDPLHVDNRWSNSDPLKHPFALYPLIFSAGRDSQYDIVSDRVPNALQYVITPPYGPNDPYYELSAGTFMGAPTDANSDGLGNGDNITNHLLNR